MLHVCTCRAAGGAQPLSWSCVRCGWPLAHQRVYFVVPSGTTVSDPPLHSGASGGVCVCVCGRWATQTMAIDIAQQNSEVKVSPGGDFKGGREDS